MSDNTLWAPDAPELAEPPTLARLPDPESVLYHHDRPVIFLADAGGERVLATLIEEVHGEDGTCASAYLAVPIEPGEIDAIVGCRMTLHEAYGLRPAWLFHETWNDGRAGPGRAWSGVVAPAEHVADPGIYLRPSNA